MQPTKAAAAPEEQQKKNRSVNLFFFFHKFQLMALTDTVFQVDTYITHHPERREIIISKACAYDNRNEW